jgi:hypothetical protein
MCFYLAMSRDVLVVPHASEFATSSTDCAGSPADVLVYEGRTYLSPSIRLFESSLAVLADVGVAHCCSCMPYMLMVESLTCNLARRPDAHILIHVISC